MSIVKLIKASHGKSVMAEYTIGNKLLKVYLAHNKPGTKHWGDFSLVVYFGNYRKEFSSYSDFIEYRKMLYAAYSFGTAIVQETIKLMDNAVVENLKLKNKPEL